jgi:ribosome biogenesis GTPase A
MSNINWYPGHMKKTMEELQSTLKVIDLVLVIVDARAPNSSINPALLKLLGNKPYLMVLNKADLADKKTTSVWLEYYQKQSINAMSLSAKKMERQHLINHIKEVLSEKIIKQKAKGLVNRPIRVAIVGIPNVGKSTIINRLAKRKAMKVENRAGVTKALKWIKIEQNLELLDSPGLLWPKFEDQEIAKKIAMLGSIKEAILPSEILAYEIIMFMTSVHLSKFNNFFKIEALACQNPQQAHQVLEIIAKTRGLLLPADKPNLKATESLVIREFQNGSFGPISLEQPH